MMTSTTDEIPQDDGRRTRRSRHDAPIAVGLGVAGAFVALLLGLLTFGVQATVEPHHLPLAIGTADAASATAMAPVLDRVAAQGGDAVAWRRVGSRAEAEALLDRKQAYGAVIFTAGPAGPSATVLVSGALNPTATQVAQSALTQVAENVTSAARAQAASRQSAGQGPAAATGAASRAAAAPGVQVVTIHPTSAAGRTLPLAASALLWIATLVTSVLALVLPPRRPGGRPLGRLLSIVAAISGAVLGTATVLGLARLWDSGITFGWEAVAFLGLVALSFALLQGAVLRWLRLPGIALLALLYLTAPAVAGLVPELLNPVYRALLWSWTPFRFSAEALRSLLFLGPNGPDVSAGIWVFGGIGLAGLLLMLAPKPRLRQARPRAEALSMDAEGQR